MHLAQAKNYVVAYDFPVGLLINFGAKSLQFKKVFNPRHSPANLRSNNLNQSNTTEYTDLTTAQRSEAL